MPQPKIPPDVQRLILDHIPSVERLEVLLLLVEGKRHAWTVAELEGQIRSTPESIAENCAALVKARLATSDEANPTAVRYRPANDALAATVSELALAYRTRRVAVIELIYADRKTAAKSFSDAFKFTPPP